MRRAWRAFDKWVGWPLPAALLVAFVLCAPLVLAQTRPNNPAGKSGGLCPKGDVDCPLGMVCKKWPDGQNKCVTECRSSRDCREGHVCARLRGCEERPDCLKICHAPVWGQP